MIELEDRDTETVLTPARKRVLAALAAAVVVHGVLLLCFASLAPLLPNPRSYVIAPTPKPPTIKLERPEETTTAEEEPKKKLDYLETNPDQLSAKPPDKADFESDKDTLAKSENPDDNKGDKPLPSQEGREDLPQFHFDTRPFTLGDQAANLASRPSAAATAPPAPAPAPPPEVQTTPPRPQPNLAVTPPPTVGPRDIALLPPTTPAPQVTPAPDRSTLLRPMQPDSRNSLPSIASPGRENTPGYQSQTEKTKMVGGLSNRGENSAAALGTPMGRYQKAISDAIGNRWYFYANRRSDLSTIGMVRVNFQVNRNGKAENVRILSNSSNETVASYSIQAIIEARIPPMPPEVANIVPSERMPVDFTFAIY